MDLEETVVPEAKDASRQNVCKARRENDYGYREVIVRERADKCLVRRQ